MRQRNESTAVYVDTQPRPVNRHPVMQQYTVSKRDSPMYLPKQLWGWLAVGICLLFAGFFLARGYHYSHIKWQIQKEFVDFVQEWEDEHADRFNNLQLKISVGNHTFGLQQTQTRSRAAHKAVTMHTSYVANQLISQVFPESEHDKQLRQDPRLRKDENLRALWRPVRQDMHRSMPYQLVVSDPDGKESAIDLGSHPFYHRRLTDAVSEGECTNKHGGVWARQECTVDEFLAEICVKVGFNSELGMYTLDDAYGGVGCFPMNQWKPAFYAYMKASTSRFKQQMWLPKTARNATTVVVRHGRDPEIREQHLSHKLKPDLEPLIAARAVGYALIFLSIICLSPVVLHAASCLHTVYCQMTGKPNGLGKSERSRY